MMFGLFFQQLILSTFSFIIVFIVGKIITSFISFKGPFLDNLFLKLFIIFLVGVVSIFLFYSIIKTHGYTVNILLIPIIGYFVYTYRKNFRKPSVDFNLAYKEFLYALLIFVLVFLFKSCLFFSLRNGPINAIFYDSYLYAMFSDILNYSNIENFSLTQIFELKKELIPYHYPELWLTAFFSWILNNSTANTYFFGVITLLTTIYIIGIVGLLKGIKSILLKILFVLIIITISNIYIPTTFIESHSGWNIMHINGAKASLIYSFILLSFYCLNKSENVTGLVILLLIPIFSNTFFPSIAGGIIMFLFIKIIFDKKNRNTWSIIFLLTVFYLLLYILFYSINRSEIIQMVNKKMFSSGIFSGFNNRPDFIKYKVVISNFIYYTIPSSFNHILFLLAEFLVYFILFYKLIQKYRNSFILSLLIIISGAVFANLTFFSTSEFYQFVEADKCFLIIVIIFLFIEYCYSFKKKNTIIIIIMLIISIYNFNILIKTNTNFNRGKIESVRFFFESALLLEPKKNIIMSLMDSSSFSNKRGYQFWYQNNNITQVLHFTKSSTFFILGNPQDFLKYNKLLNFSDSVSYKHSTPINVWRGKGQEYTLESFIDYYKIKYFYIKKGIEIPIFIADNIEKVIVSENTGSRFIKIK